MTYELSPVLPLASFLILGIFGHWIRDKAHLVAVPAIVLSLGISVLAFFDVAGGDHSTIRLYTWLTSGMLDVHIALSIDRLTSIMLLLVTTVSALVHIYTIGYMQGEPGYARFFSYIALFTFSMLMLVLADNFLQLFVFWEAVGLCSYLLIGHWYERQSAVAAATKAFIVNRVGDFGFILGLLLVFATFDSLDYATVFANVGPATAKAMNILGPLGGSLEVPTTTVICLLLFMGAVGKSAQFPLHVWLPDAMEGPTPVSALIHAATMVAAGVYLVGRTFPLFEQAPPALLTVAFIGGFTAIFAASMGLVATDIKRVMAFSTVSQLGYMMLAMGAGAEGAGAFHLFTHAFFKALLFLTAGSVIYALHRAGAAHSGFVETSYGRAQIVPAQDMRAMGGLRTRMPITFITMVIGAL